mmetsp:Transcript_11135/g.21648  ORF Transcript_11135/g.21648 Transcript_11135/m.21648 type:complete len:255 (-) Transcript_11135:1482-2246(-)
MSPPLGLHVDSPPPSRLLFERHRSGRVSSLRRRRQRRQRQFVRHLDQRRDGQQRLRHDEGHHGDGRAVNHAFDDLGGDGGEASGRTIGEVAGRRRRRRRGPPGDRPRPSIPGIRPGVQNRDRGDAIPPFHSQSRRVARAGGRGRHGRDDGQDVPLAGDIVPSRVVEGPARPVEGTHHGIVAVVRAGVPFVPGRRRRRERQWHHQSSSRRIAHRQQQQQQQKQWQIPRCPHPQPLQQKNAPSRKFAPLPNPNPNP